MALALIIFGALIVGIFIGQWRVAHQLERVEAMVQEIRNKARGYKDD
jgi:hypothetical protein